MKNEAANARAQRRAAAQRLIDPGQLPVEEKTLKPAPIRRIVPKPANIRIDVAKVATS